MGVIRDISNISIKYFSDLKYARGGSIFFPEIFPYFRNSVNSDAIKIVLFDNTINPFK